jgi:hypothetical protein
VATRRVHGEYTRTGSAILEPSRPDPVARKPHIEAGQEVVFSHPIALLGSSRVEFRLQAVGDVTVLTLTHSDLPAEAIEPHTHIWEHTLPCLVAAASGNHDEALLDSRSDVVVQTIGFVART